MNHDGYSDSRLTHTISQKSNLVGEIDECLMRTRRMGRKILETGSCPGTRAPTDWRIR